MQNPNNDNLEATGKMDGSGAGVPKGVVISGPNLGNGVKGQAAVNGTVPPCRYYESDSSDLGDDGEIRAKGPKRAGLPYHTQPGPPVSPPHYASPQTQNQGGQPQQPARGQPRPSTQAPVHAQRPPLPARGYGQGGQFAPGTAPHTAQQQQQQPRPYHAPPPPGGQSHAGYPHAPGYPQAGYTQASAASHYPATTQRQPAAQKPAQKK